MEFFHALGEYRFLQLAVAAGVLAGVACGVVGTYVVTRRITYVAGGIAHCVLGGMGAAMYLRETRGWAWLTPMHGAVLAALVAAVLIGLVTLRFRQREDTLISALWAAGMAIGVLFMAATPGYKQDLVAYLFGNILMITQENLWLVAGLDAVVVLATLLFYGPFLAVCFDEEHARSRGLWAEGYYLLLLAMTAMTVVLLVTIVGIVMLIALLTLPAAVAGHWTKKLWQMMIVAAGLSVLLTLGGLAASYGPNVPSGAAIILLCVAAYAVSLSLRRLVDRMRTRRRGECLPDRLR